MATINSKKLLPGSEKKEVFLVPTTSIVPSAPKFEGVKSDEKKTSKTPLLLEGKVIQVTELFNNNLLLKAADRERKRKDEERKEFDEREKKLEEKKLGKKGQQGDLISKVPGSSLFDRLARFTGFTLLGFIFNNYSNLLPKLNALGAIIKPVAVGFGYFAEGILSGTIDWIEKGYKAHDTVRDWTKQLGGENFQKLFDDFSGALNVFLNTAIITGLAGIRGGSLQLKKGLGSAAATSLSSAAPALDKQIKDAKKYFSKYSFRTIKETAPITESRILNMLTRTAMGLPAAKRLPTRQALKDPKFATAYKPQKETYVSARDKELSKSIALGGEERSALRKAGIGTLTPKDQKKIDSLGYKALKNIGLTDKQIYDAFGFGSPRKGIPFDERFEKPKKPEKIKPAKVTAETVIKGVSKIPEGDALKSLGKQQALSIAKAKAKFMKFGYSNSNLITIANSVDTEPITDRLAAHSILKKRGLADRVTYVPEMPSIPTTRIKPQPQIQPAEEIIPKAKGTKGVFGRGIGRVGQRAALKIGGKNAAKFVSGIPVVGALVDFLFSLAMGDPPDEAAAGAAGAAIGAALVGFFVGSGTFGLGSFLGGVIGGFAGDIIGRFLYKTAKSIFGKKEKPKSYAQGGIVDPRRQIKVTKKQEQRIGGKEPSPVELRPLFSDAKLKFLYGSEGSIKLIKSISGNLAGVGGFIGSLMSASINLLFGQKFDGALLKYIGLKYGKSAENLTRIASDGIVRMIQNQIAYGERTDKTRKKQGFLSWAKSLLGIKDEDKDVKETPEPPTQKPPSQKPTQGSFASVLPKGNPVFTSGFGSRWGRQHKGIDIGVDAGSPVTALGEGKVLDIYPNFGGNGVGIVVQHSDGTKIVYGHVNSNVNIGDTVKKGQIIATVKGWYNAYGNKDNTHLHLERYVDGSAVDPSGYLNSIEKTKLDKVSSLQKQNPDLLAQTPVYAKHQEFTYAIQPVIMA